MKIEIRFPVLSTLLFIVFLILKLCNVIDWAWIFVFLPLIISCGIFLVLLVVATVIYIKS